MTKKSEARKEKLKSATSLNPTSVAQVKPDATEVLNNFHHAALSVTIRGLIASIPGVPETMLISFAKVFGRILGEIFGGSQEEVTRVRIACRQAFETSMMGTPIPAIPAAAPEAPKE